ncbi:methylated-DNA--[protein]-cysteine S-methyltransferase [Formicincola oecophyllae]|uniref:Methylated-DNA--[protein]-cysteine S-methyltransferase n=1 Tax=Formicincola oecophyllae TaxID=2558361 RepID=A0A4Y6UAD0_9PROT|nr:methylated-DNA--[protein]-cysteine S-methyltransferase [Formicincola oecophyllae]QDH14362.1 methylated-DNA--[protein]-cysteine S-methyltransferase [Formicincola oecophyllae]
MPQLSCHTPVGDLTLSEEEGALVAVDEGWGRDQTPTPLLLKACQALEDYFDGKAVDLSAFPIKPPYGTAYQKKVWDVVRSIPHGQTRTYGQVAARAGGSAQSVGQAMGANPLLMFVPCHRVVGARGVGGYRAFEGERTKAWLIALEGD